MPNIFFDDRDSFELTQYVHSPEHVALVCCIHSLGNAFCFSAQSQTDVYVVMFHSKLRKMTFYVLILTDATPHSTYDRGQ